MTTATRLLCLLILTGALTVLCRQLPDVHRRAMARVHADGPPGLSCQSPQRSRHAVPRQRAHR